MASAESSLRLYRRCPFRHQARVPQVRTHSFIAQPPHLRRFALVTKASRFLARSPCSTAPSMRFLFIGSRFTLHASSPHSVALMQLRFTSFAVTSLWRDLHPQECAHAGRTNKKSASQGAFRSAGRIAQARLRYSSVRVSISILSPMAQNSGTCSSMPVEILAFFITLPDDVSPLTAGSV